MHLKKPARVGIIGGGIFGLSCALNLNRTHEVTVFEQGNDILRGATYANHNRHHYGFHYPRSPETARQCLESRALFEETYGECCFMNFADYYGVSRDNSLTTPENYVRFCEQMGLEFREEWPAEGVLDKSKIALCLRVKEGIYDYDILRKLVEKRLTETATIAIKKQHRVVSGRIEPGGEKVLVTENGGQVQEHRFDFIINAMYASHNRFCEWFGFPKRLFQFNLQELDVIELPVAEKLGITVQDGPFPSFLPLGHTNQYLLAHVIASQLVREIQPGTIPLLNRVPYIESNWAQVQNACAEYIPLLKKAKYIRSIFVDRVVDANRLNDDARLTEITRHGNGCWSIFAAKIITCEATGRKLAAEIREQS
ncbi:MAG: FAD-dependent oxidoreductase [Dehalococcoidales bacterium]|nr:FAD-dependent oxidoreductase [Dehalococcoidales bacterium]